MIKHFLSKQKLTSALTGTLGSEKKSISRKASFLHHKDATPRASHQQAPSRKHKEQHQHSLALHATQSQRSTKQRKQSTHSHKKPAVGDRQQLSQHQATGKDGHRTMIPPSATAFATVARAEHASGG